MTKELSGAELVSFIKERQAKQVRNLKQEHHVAPRLAVVMHTGAGDVSELYVRMKQRYADDVGIMVDIHRVQEDQLINSIEKLNSDSNIHGIIVQLPLLNVSQTQAVCDSIDSNKDVDGLGAGAKFASATAEAIDWLLAGYNIDLADKEIAVVGHGKLVGKPLVDLWVSQGHEPRIVDVDTPDREAILRASDVIVSAVGLPGVLRTRDVKSGAVVVDAGTASEGGQVVGDAEQALRARNDITITPVKGGVGPLTIAVLFDHVIQAALTVAFAS